MSEVPNFATFFSNYKSQIHNRSNEPNKFVFYSRQKLLWMVMQIESVPHDVHYITAYTRHAIRMTDSFCIYKYGAYVFIYTKTGNIYIEKPSSSRLYELRDTSYIKYTLSQYNSNNQSFNNDYILTDTGMIVFRDRHDEFYELQYEGRGYDAMEYALNILGVRE